MGAYRKTTMANKPNKTLKFILQIIFIVIIVVAAVGIRLAIAGGDWGCFFSEDAALCVAVKGLGG